jgi:hypothetical protein
MSLIPEEDLNQEQAELVRKMADQKIGNWQLFLMKIIV